MSPLARQRLIEPADIRKAAMLLTGLPLAWLGSPDLWASLSRHAAAVPPFTPRVSRRLPSRLVQLLGGSESQALARLQAVYFQDCLLTLRASAPRRLPVEVATYGSENIEAALEDGSGAILWVAELAFAPLIAKLALRQAGFAVTHLSRRSHRFSETKAGIALLNPVQTRVENRYIQERVIMDEESALPALRSLQRRLTENGIVSITAGGEASEVVEAPFMGGQIALPVGALHLGLITSASVLPLFVIQTAPCRFEARIEPRLALRPDISPQEAYQQAVGEFILALEAVLELRPELWSGWQRLR